MATSPQARIPFALVRSPASTRMPLSTSATPPRRPRCAARRRRPRARRSAVDRRGRRRAHALGAARALDRLDAGAEEQLDALIVVHVAVERAELRAEHAQERQVERLDQRDVHALLARGRGHLAADPAARRSRRARPPPSITAAQRVGVRDRPQHVHAVEVGAGDGQAPRLGAGGDQQTVVVEALAAGQDDRALARVDRLGRRRGAQLDLVLAYQPVLLQ